MTAGRRVKHRNRIQILDEFRGLALLNMIAYHLCYDLAVLYGVAMPWFFSRGTAVWQEYICLSFFIAAGISTALSRRPFIRAGKVALCAAIITLATGIIYPSQIVLFGILHCMAASMFIYALLRKTLLRHPIGGAARLTGLIISAALTIFTWNTANGFCGFGKLAIKLPDVGASGWLFPLGFLPENFFSADYFPLLPYFFVFLAASFWANGRVRSHKEYQPSPELLAENPTGRPHIAPLAFLGRHSLLIYMLHQPVIMGVLMLITWQFR